MRIPRQYIKNGAREQYFHIISRVVDKRFALCEASKGTLEFFLKQHERFSGCEIGAYCIMDNHFHLLIKVPARPEKITEDEVLYRMGGLVSPDRMAKVRSRAEDYHRAGNQEAIDELLKPYAKRMYDLSQFMKDFKQRFTQWYNYQNGRVGTLWESRFKSVLLEAGESVRRVAQYIDLNPVRAGIVSNLEDYSWCSYTKISLGDEHSRWRFYNFFSPEACKLDRENFDRPDLSELGCVSVLNEAILRYEKDLRMHIFGNVGSIRDEVGTEEFESLKPSVMEVRTEVSAIVPEAEEVHKASVIKADKCIQSNNGVVGCPGGKGTGTGNRSHTMDQSSGMPHGCEELSGEEHLNNLRMRIPEISESMAFGSPEFIKEFYRRIPETFVPKKFF